jgi:hypothetical protein
VVARIVVVLVCAAVIGLLVSSLQDAKACNSARTDLFQVVIGRLSTDREPGALRTIEAQCRGTDGLVAASAALDRQGRSREALALAYRAAVREPLSATAWNSVAVVALSGGRRQLAIRAAARARRLSPLGPQPLPVPSRAPAGPDGGP